MLLYNSLDPESSQIADWYDDLHPDVVHCDINVQYDPTVQPDGYWATSKYISPLKFKQVFIDGTGPFAQCLAANPQILCIVTTRGIPGAISDTVSPFTCSLTGDPPCPPGPIGGIYASLEATLCRYRLGDLSQEPSTWDPDLAFVSIQNPYHVSGSPYELQPFDDFIEDACDDPLNPVCLGDMFLVSRLDSATPEVDFDGNGVINNLDGVRRLLLQYGNFEINKYAVTALADHSVSAFPAIVQTITGGSVMLWNAEWCALLEPTDQFVHGADDPVFDEETDGPYVEWPLIAVETQGVHHQGEQIFASYAYNYNAHPCGVFLSLESWNGWQIHAGDGSYGTSANLGQVMEWLGPGGGGFAIGYIQEPSGNIVKSRVVYKNFFDRGLTWSEAATGSVGHFRYATALGDPLARLVVHNPDVNADRIINSADYQIVLTAIGTSNPQADINKDGIVNQADINLVRDAYGRNCTEPPTEPFPGIGCGDLVSNGGAPGLDGWVNQDDLDAFYAIWTALNGMSGPVDCPLLDCWAQCPCQGDFNGDAIIDSSDEDVVQSHAGGGGTYLFDFDGNGCFDVLDADLFFDYLAGIAGAEYVCDDDPYFDPLFDVNCNLCIGVDDLGEVLGHIHAPTTPCQP